MAIDIPTIEPSIIRAGDTTQWIKSLSDYPASDSWVLSYKLTNQDYAYAITSTASGSDHLVSISAATSATHSPGKYKLIGYVTKAAERYTIDETSVQILPNLAAITTGYDTRSTAKQTLDLLDAAMVAQGANAWAQEYEIAGRRMKFRGYSEFLAYRSRVAAEVKAEENAERLRSGLKLKNRISVRL
jgi:hypothetical protein